MVGASAAGLLLEPAAHTIEAVSVVAGSVLLPVSVGWDVINIVRQAKSKAELREKMMGFVKNLSDNLNTNKKIPLQQLCYAIGAFETKIDQIPI